IVRAAAPPDDATIPSAPSASLAPKAAAASLLTHNAVIRCRRRHRRDRWKTRSENTSNGFHILIRSQSPAAPRTLQFQLGNSRRRRSRRHKLVLFNLSASLYNSTE